MYAKNLLEKKSRPLVTVTPDVTFTEAMDLLVANDIGCLPVLDRGRLVGMVFSKTALRWIHANKGQYHESTVADVMARDIVVGRPSDELAMLTAMMDKAGVTHVPIISQGDLVGVVSQRDIIHSQATDQQIENRYLNLYMDGLGSRDQSGHV